MAFDVGAVVAKIDADLTGFKNGISQAQDLAGGFGGKIKDVAGTLGTLAAAGAVAAVAMAGIFTKSSISAAGEAEAEMARVDALLKATAEDMKYSTVVIKGNTSELKAQTKAIDSQIESKRTQLRILQLSEKADTEEYKNIKKSIAALELQKVAIENTTEVKDKSIKVTNKHALSQQQLRKEADKLSASFIKLGFDDEETSTAFAKSIKVTKNLAETQKEMALAADFARLQDISITDAQRLLQLAYMGNQRVLKQYGIELDDNATKQQIFSAVQKVAGGQADAYSKTYKGAMERMKVETENLKETIGAIFLPKLTEMIDFVGKAIGKIIEWENSTKTIENGIKSVGDAINVTIEWLKKYETQIGLTVTILTILFLPALIAVSLQLTLNFVTSILKATWGIISFGIEGWKAVAMLVAKTLQLGLATAAFIWHTAVTIAQTTATVALTVATWAYNAAMAVLTLPIWAVIAVIVALIAIGYLLIKNWDKIKDAASDLGKWVHKQWETLVENLKFVGDKILDALMWPFNEAKKKIEEAMKWIKDKIDFTKRSSPSVLDIVKSGVAKVNDALGGLQYGINVMPNMAGATVNNAGGMNSTVAVRVDMSGAIITDAYGAAQMGELVGDAIVKRLQQNIRI